MKTLGPPGADRFGGIGASHETRACDRRWLPRKPSPREAALELATRDPVLAGHLPELNDGPTVVFGARLTG
jgi:hypothetical protein